MTELYHYGVRGMRWGVRKDPQKAYEKALKERLKRDKKAANASEKYYKLEKKVTKRLARPSLTDFGIAKERRLTKKLARVKLKNAKADARAKRFAFEMEKAFANIPVQELTKKK